MQILDKFMSVGSLHQWIDYLMPEDRGHYKLGTSSSIDEKVLPNSTNFDQLMVEARTVLSRYLSVLESKKKGLIMFQAKNIVIFTHVIFTWVENYLHDYIAWKCKRQGLFCIGRLKLLRNSLTSRGCNLQSLNWDGLNTPNPSLANKHPWARNQSM